MAKAMKVEQDFKLQSLKDVGYQQGKTESNILTIARFAMSRIPTLGDLDASREDQMNKEQREELRSGYMVYFNESVKFPRYFKVADGNLVESQDDDDYSNFKGEKRKLDVHGVFAITQAAMNDLKSNDKVWYQLVQELRTDFNAYASNRIGDLIRKAKEIRRAQLGVKKERVQAKVFGVWLDETLDDILTRVRNADARGNDSTADVELIKRKIAAFKAAS
jgi:hypothetical protein